jgi:hypothetical protein
VVFSNHRALHDAFVGCGRDSGGAAAMAHLSDDEEEQIHALGHSIGAIARSLYPGLAKNLLFACCLDMQYKDKLQMDEEIWSTKALTKIVWRLIDLPLKPIGRRNPSFAGRG